VIVEQGLDFLRARFRALDVRRALPKTPLEGGETGKFVALRYPRSYPAPRRPRAISRISRVCGDGAPENSQSGGLRQLAYPQLGVAPRDRQRYPATRMLCASYPF
jgi:hypothetical protein